MLVVGHNDAGFEPCTPAVQVPDLNTARQLLIDEVNSWFSVELGAINEHGEVELTHSELRAFTQRVRAMQQRSTLVLRGHCFWIQ